MRPIHIITVGGFGEAVAREMATELDAVITKSNGERVFPGGWPLARFHVLASWRQVPSIADQIDSAAFAWRVPWLPVIAEHPFVNIGPGVVPGVGACYACFRRRLLQHSQTADLIEALELYYEANSKAGPQGYLPSAVSLTAMTACDLIGRLLHEPSVEAAKVYQLNLLSFQMLKCSVIGVHGCRKCGSGRDERTRSYSQLQSDLVRLWPKVQK